MERGSLTKVSGAWGVRNWVTWAVGRRPASPESGSEEEVWEILLLLQAQARPGASGPEASFQAIDRKQLWPILVF